MGGLALLAEHWGYGALFAVVVLGNVGLPVPEETIFTLTGYLAWRGDLRLWLVLLVGITSASVGDNVGYWLGRRLGGAALGRHWARVGLRPAMLETSQRFVLKHGAVAVFVARFVPGLRFAAGPLAGITGVPTRVFFIANLLGACVYVPVMVGIGYAIGRGVGPRLEQVLRRVVAVEHVVLATAILLTVSALLIRMIRHRGRARSPVKPPSS